MKIILPCRLGEKFTPQKFVTWNDGKRVYKPANLAEELMGVDVFACKTRCLAIPTIVTASKKIMSYDETGEFEQQFNPRYTVDLPISSEYKEGTAFGLNTTRKFRLSGIRYKEDKIFYIYSAEDCRGILEKECNEIEYELFNTFEEEKGGQLSLWGMLK